MTKFLFIQNIYFELLGPMYISAVLKQQGHDCRLVIGNKSSDFEGVIKVDPPDYLLFSVMTGSHLWAIKIARELKEKFGLKTVFGGPHPTFCPEIIQEQAVDIICRHEGEEPLVELANRVSKGITDTQIGNLWIKDAEGNIHRNDLRPRIGNLDELPFPDRDLYKDYPNIFKGTKAIVVSRGCLFDCSYCYNHITKKLYNSSESSLKFRSPGNVIREIKELKDKKLVRNIAFEDSIFTFNKAWLMDFLQKYTAERIAIPFSATTRADMLDEEMIVALKEGGCKNVWFGIETGSENMRRLVLKKNITNERIIKTAKILKKHNLKFLTYNIVGLPGETLQNALETIELNIKMKTNYPWCSIYTPYPKTELADYAINNGFLANDYTFDEVPNNFHTTSVIKQKNIRELVNLHKFFQTAVLFPWSIPVIKKLVKLKTNVFFEIWWAIIYLYIHKQSEYHTWRETLRFGLGNIKLLFADNLNKKGLNT